MKMSTAENLIRPVVKKRMPQNIGTINKMLDRNMDLFDKTLLNNRIESSVKKDINRHLARAIASAVEEKVLRLEITRIRLSLIRQLVLADTDAMVKAQRQLQMATG